MAGVNYLDLAWAAGFLDGEGTISFQRHNATSKAHPSPYFNLVLFASNSNKEALIRLQRLFGGSVASHQKVAGHKRVYRWRLYGSKAITIIALLLPYFTVKREVANLAVSYSMRPKEKLTGKLYGLTLQERDYRESVWKEFHRLNQRGAT